MEEFSRRRIQIGCNELRVQLLSVLIVVAIIQIVEFLLLEIAYNLFSGGFLQPYAYLAWSERIAFIGLSLWMDLLIFGGIGMIWYRFRSRLGTRPLVAAYFFVFCCLSAMGVWLTLKYEILSYFNDTINFLIIKNLGGGSLSTALSYFANETAIYGLALFALLVIFLIGLKLVRRMACTEFERSPSRRSFLRPTTFTLALCFTIFIAYFVTSNPALRHGLKKKTSFWIVSNLFDQVTDLDRDGYGVFTFPRDPEPFDSSIYPGALDIPGNGIDENGYGGDFEWEKNEHDALAHLSPQPGSNIILILLESTRSDLLDKQINGKAVAPKIRKLALEGSTIDYAYSHTGYTVPSLVAIFNRSLSFDTNRVSLTDYLEKSGYALSFISGEDESFGDGASKIGMNRPGRYLFDARSALDDRVYPSKNPASLRLSEERVLQAFMERSSQVDWSRPQFFYINFQAAHFPYSHPTMPRLLVDEPIPRSKIKEENREWLEATYWNAVGVADDAVGHIVSHLQQLGVYEQSLIVIIGDHGESLFDDHFLGHGHALNDVQTHIPLILNKPNIEIHSAIGQVDIADLIVQLATDQFDQAQWNTPDKIIPQIVGSWKHPQLIGTVSYGGFRTVLDHRTRKVFFSDLQQWADFDSAWNDPDLGPRTRNLINIWEKVQWENHNARTQQRAK